jgi:hypothetical protein
MSDIIKTKDKTEFLKFEWDVCYNRLYLDYDGFVEDMEDIIVPCETCGNLYFTGCKKRCDCDE